MKNVWKIVFVIIGALIGAGFASGQEIYSFFYHYAVQGIFGIILCSVLLSITIGKVMIICVKYDIDTYEEFLKIILHNRKISMLVNAMVNVFLVITFFIMIAGFGAYFFQELQINAIIGSSILALICFFIFQTNVKGLVKANEMIVPLLIGFIILIGILNIDAISFNITAEHIKNNITDNFILSSLLYASYNSILLIPVLLTLRRYLQTKKQIITISAITGIITGVLGIILFFILSKVDVSITTLEMPAVYVVGKFFYSLKIVYGFIILASIFTTSISIGMSLLQNITKNKKSYTQFAVILCITSVIVSKIGFSNLVNTLYPLFGYLGFIQIIGIIKHKNKSNY